MPLTLASETNRLPFFLKSKGGIWKTLSIFELRRKYREIFYYKTADV